MAIGIPLSSLDVVVGISGVHYVLQGLRQIDRELDNTSKKRVTAAMQVPDLSAQFRQTAVSAALGVSGIQAMTSAVQDMQRTMTRGIVDPNARREAMETIELARQAQVTARTRAQEAAAATRVATTAEREYNRALREQQTIQKDLDRATKAHAETERQLVQLLARDYHNYVTTRTGAGIRAQNILNAPIGPAATGGVSQLQQTRAAEYIQTTVEALENRRIDREKDLNHKLAIQLAERNRLNTALTALPPTGPLATAATSSRLLATALQNQANTAGVAAANLQVLAGNARNFLASTAGFITRGQQIQMLLAGVGSFVAGAARGVLALGSLGVTAAGTAGHVGKLVLDFARLPAIAGPLTGGLSLIASGFMTINKSILLVAGSLAALSFKEILQEGMEFEEAMSNIKAVAQYTIQAQPREGETQQAANVRALAAEMEELDYITLKLGADTIYSNTEIANLMETMLRGGVAVSSLSEDTVRAVADLASATKTTTTDAATAVASTIKMFGATAEEIPHYADIIAAAVNTTNMTVGDFSSAIRQLGPLAQALGISFEDVTTLLAEVGAKGYFGEIAGTSLRNMLLYLSPRTKPAIQEMKEAGLWVGGTEPYRVVGEEEQANYNTRLANYQTQLANYEKAMADFRSGKRKTQPLMPTKPTAPVGKEVAGEKGHPIFYDEAGNLRPMEEIINLIQGATKGMSDEQLAEFSDRVFGKRSGSATLLLSKDDADQFKRTKELLNSISASQVAEFRLENVKGKIELLSGSLKSLASVFFMNWLQAPIFGALNKLIPSVNAVLDFFGKADEGGRSRGQKFFDSLGKGLATGDLGGAWVDMMQQVSGLSSNEWSARIRVIMRWLQLGRDAVVTFGQAWRGLWGGAATREINPVIRLLGIFATHWGNIWRSIGQLAAGQINLRTFFQQIFQGFDRLWRELVAWVQTTWPDLKVVIQQAWQGLKDLGSWAWTNYLKPALTELWNNIASQENRDALGNKVRELFALGEDFLGKEVGPWLGGIGKAIEGWFSKPENQQAVSGSARGLGSTIGGFIAEGIRLIIEAPIDFVLNIRATNTADVAGGAAVSFINNFLAQMSLQTTNLENDAVSASFGGIARAFIDQGDQTGAATGAAFQSSFLFSIEQMSTLLLIQMIKATLFIPMLFFRLAELAGVVFINAFGRALSGLLPMVVGVINALGKAWNAFWKGTPVPQLHTDLDFKPLQEDLDEALNNWNKDVGSHMFDEGLWPAWMKDLQKDLATWLAGPGSDKGTLQPKREPGKTEVYVPGQGYTPEQQAPPQKINPVTGVQAPGGYIWIYDPQQLKWALTAQYELNPQKNPITGQMAPEGYKWVLDSKDNSYDLVPVSFTQVGGRVPDTSKIAAEGYVWILDAATGIWTLTPASQVKAPATPPGVVGAAAAAAYGQEPYDDAGQPNPNYVPPVGPPPGNPDSPMFNTQPPITINAQGLTDEMFLNKLGDSLEMRWQALNAGV